MHRENPFLIPLVETPLFSPDRLTLESERRCFLRTVDFSNTAGFCSNAANKREDKEQEREGETEQRIHVHSSEVHIYSLQI
jgi:hypothetical protein